MGPSAEGRQSKYLKNLSFEREKGELKNATGDDVVIISGPAFRAIQQNTKSLFGSGADMIWYNGGRHAGEVDAKRLKELSKRMSPEDFLKVVDDVYTNIGWGRVSHANLSVEAKAVDITIRNGPFVRGQTTDAAVCAFVTGFLAGLFSVIFEADVKVEELSCAATGKESCEFRAKW